MTDMELWTTIYQRFDPKEAVGVAQKQWQVQRPYSPIGRIQKELRKDRLTRDLLNRPRILLLGTPGTGKTTEVRLLGEQQAGEDFVLILDLVQLFERVATNAPALHDISAWEVCYLAGLSLYQAAVERLALPWDDNVLRDLQAAWLAAAGKTNTDAPQGKLSLPKIAAAVFQGASLLLDGGVVLGAATALADKTLSAMDWDWSLPLGKSRQQLPDDLPESRAILAAVNRIIGEIQHRHHRVLLIIDGLDRIQEISRARSLFVNSLLLSRFACPVVISGPFVLRHHPSVGALAGGFRVEVLVNEPALLRENPRQLGPGYAFLRELFLRRVSDLPRPNGGELIPDELLRDLAYHSGGHARDFVRLVGELAGEVMVSIDQDPARREVTAEMVAQVINTARLDRELGLSDVHLDLLRQVMDDPNHTLPQHDETWKMLESFRLLPYPNKHEWLYPHPLLHQFLDDTRRR